MDQVYDISSEQRLEQLVLAGLTLTSEATLDGVLRRVAEIATDVIGARYAAIGVLAPDGVLLESFTTHGAPEGLLEHVGGPPSGLGVLGLVAREGRPIRLANIAGHPESSGLPSKHPPMQSFLGVPVSGRRGVFGNLYLTEKLGGGEFTEEDEHIAVLLASMTAAAVENARLHEESARILAEVHQLHRSRERFFAMVNHELRNALAAVLGWSELLVRKKDPALVPRAAYEVLESAEQAVALISDLLDLSRLDEDRLKPNIRLIESGALARRAVGRAMPSAQTKEIALTLDLPTDLPPIETDASRVEQILVNLLTNAIKYTPAGTTIRISAQHKGDRVTYWVTDEGPGIREDQAERIFDIYVTKEDGDKQGIGLGLPLSRRLARLLGGELHAVPQVGSGVFVLSLPTRRSA